MDTRVVQLTEGLSKNPGATGEVLTSVRESTKVRMPEDYLQFMQMSNGAEGFIGDGGYLMLWRMEELVECNRAYRVDEYAPGLFLFGSDGAGEAYAFDTRNADMLIVAVPFVGMSLDYAHPCGTSFTDFLQHLSELRPESNGK